MSRGRRAKFSRGLPLLRFTDLISGPASGIGDGLGSGVIVTIWGQFLGSSQGSSTIKFKDSAETVHDVAHTYYWKNADGALPGGPADLYSSHRMHEVCISIPAAAATGAGTLYAVVNGVNTNELPFTVRAGTIYHVKTTGSNGNTGTFASPWRNIDGDTNNGAGNGRMAAGSTVYSHGVEEINGTAGGGIYSGYFLRSLSGTLTEQIGIVAYPNTRPLAQAYHRGIHPYLSSGLVISKIHVEAGNYVLPGDDSILSPSEGYAIGITTKEDSRIVACEMNDIAGRVTSGYHGAITGVSSGASNVKVLGNYIHDWGGKNSSHYGHTTYFTNRVDYGPTISPWEFGFNHLKDNGSKHGLHSYDESFAPANTCGDVSGTILVHDNVIINQKGAGINIGSYTTNGDPCWTVGFDCYNNILINTGLGPDDEIGVVPRALSVTGIGNCSIYNNTIYEWSDETGVGEQFAAIAIGNWPVTGATILVQNNIVYSSQDVDFYRVEPATLSQVDGDKNIWHCTVGSPVSDIIPNYDNTPISTDPLLTVTGQMVIVNASSPAKNAGIDKSIMHDIYGKPRTSAHTIGAVEVN